MSGTSYPLDCENWTQLNLINHRRGLIAYCNPPNPSLDVQQEVIFQGPSFRGLATVNAQSSRRLSILPI
jgi:hypothetical protein